MTPEEIVKLLCESKIKQAVEFCVSAERERCAMIVETHVQRRYGATGGSPPLEPVCKRIAEEIREGEK